MSVYAPYQADRASWGIHALGAVVVQPDINWCGGLTEARCIVAMAAAWDLPVIPHGSSVFSYHLQYAFPNCPFGEFLVMSPAADRIAPVFGDLLQN